MKKPFRRAAFVVLGLTLAIGTMTAQPPGAMPARPANPQPVALVLEDQFNRKSDLAAYRGAVVVLVYGDRKAFDAAGRLRLKITGAPDAAPHNRLVHTVQNLRYEAAAGR